MKKQTFISILVGTVGGLLFSLGMCMCLIPEWNTFKYGVICGVVGGILLLIFGLTAFVKSGKKIHIDLKTVGKVLFGIVGTLVFGTGMAMITVWHKIFFGIVVGIVGIVLLICLIPMCIGFKE